MCLISVGADILYSEGGFHHGSKASLFDFDNSHYLHLDRPFAQIHSFQRQTPPSFDSFDPIFPSDHPSWTLHLLRSSRRAIPPLPQLPQQNQVQHSAIVQHRDDTAKVQSLHRKTLEALQFPMMNMAPTCP